MALFERSSYCLVTGASKGLGKEIAIQLSQGWSKAGVKSDLILFARCLEGLQKTKAHIDTSSPGVNVHLVQADLGDLDSLEDVFFRAAKLAAVDPYQQYILIHNAATTGDITKPAIQQTKPHLIQSYFAVNFTSMFILTAHFLSHFTSGHRLVVNITSPTAQIHKPGTCLYNAGKAARNVYMEILAVENPGVRLLSYAPGAVDTEMLQCVPEQSFSEVVRKQVKEFYARGFVLSCQESVSKFIHILVEDKFENGALVAYHQC